MASPSDTLVLDTTASVIHWKGTKFWGRSDPAHIHMVVKEPDTREYWIDEIVFTGDPLVDARYRARAESRGGNGIVTPTRDANAVWQVRRDITLEP